MACVLSELRDDVLRIRINRPDAHNALDEELIEALHAAFDEAGRSKGARAVLLAGEGKSFCAGADLAWMRRQGSASEAENQRSALRLAELYEKIDSLPLPVVARAHGAAIGGGVGLLAVSDVILAARSATFSLAEVRLGLVPAVISPFLIRKIGASHARALILLGRRSSSEEALRIGLVHRVVEDGHLDAAVDEAMQDLKAAGPQAIARAKRLLREVARRLSESPGALASFTAGEIAAARAGEEGRAGTAAFLEKKRPPWAARGEG